MEQKKLYTIKIASQITLCTNSKEVAQEVWEILSESSLFILHTDYIWEPERIDFYYPEKLCVELSSAMIDLFPTKIEAQRSKENWEKAAKMKLIVKKKPKP